MEFITPLITLLSGMILAYVGYRYQISSGKFSTKRERQLKNISRIERHLTLHLETEGIYLQLEEIRLKHQEIRLRYQDIPKELDLIKRELESNNNQLEENKLKHQEIPKELSRIGKVLVDLKDRKDKITLVKTKKKFPQTKEKISARDENELQSITAKLEEEGKQLQSLSAYLDEEQKRLEEMDRRLEDKRKLLIEKVIDEEKETKTLNDIHEALNVHSARLKEMNKEISLSDIDVICKIIDPSGKLARYLFELEENNQKLFQGGEKAGYIQKARDLRYKILKLLETKIV